ncbi:MAG: uracil-DNA glycosylase [Gammaproteobacteria bacterium]|uniref:Uracil-DNA glycosylase n=1 Tax=Candidatus Thiopontia autotrophica TaxID=2841688 RepID=A0A8J6P735_9GAMM|nr:uracil-DNA glycosylase [Candidatus Thiopontia autotrophica]MBL6969206.1 uracil-DNA glycosylase [Gammaproteobacteria bacterium]
MPATEQIKLGESWKQVLLPEFDKPYMVKLREFLLQRKRGGHTIFPPSNRWFNAFDHTPFKRVKVVIIGQDPYHGDGQAHGLCFSVQPKIKIPPSLVNIYKELESDIGVTNSTGTLTSWADQGVLLLNAVLTVESGSAGAHQGKGWETFTDAAIDHLNRERDHLVFILWGAYAQKKGQRIDREHHLVIQAPHPSPLSAHRGFFGSRPFSQTNDYLLSHGIKPIEWKIES